MRVRLTVVSALSILTLSVTGCGSSQSSDSAPPVTEQPVAVASPDVTADATVTGDYLDTLYAPDLHAGIDPADPGAAYIEIDGQRITFAAVECTVRDEPGAQRFFALATQDSDGVGHQLYVERSIGGEIGWSWEDEYVQLALLTTPATAESSGMYSNSMIQHERAQGEGPEWDHGDGASPVVRVVGSQATATGTMSGVPFAEAPLEGSFVAAVTCP